MGALSNAFGLVAGALANSGLPNAAAARRYAEAASAYASGVEAAHGDLYDENGNRNENYYRDVVRDAAAGFAGAAVVEAVIATGIAAPLTAAAATVVGTAALPLIGIVAALIAAEFAGGLIGPVLDSLTDLMLEILADPLVLDLNGDGLELASLAESATHFDLDADGVNERVGWIGSGDGFLVRDLNGNGQVDGVQELFGSAHVDGFDDLAAVDTDGNGKIDQSDAVFGSLRVWRDADANGASNVNELLTMSEAGIVSINLSYVEVNDDLAGNTIARIGSYTTTGGNEHEVGSVWFAQEEPVSLPPIPENADIDELISLPNLGGSGAIPDLRTAMYYDSTLKAMVEDLARNFQDFESFTDFKNGGFLEILYRWTGIDLSLPNEGEDDLLIKAIEAFTGRPLEALNPHQQNRIEEVWNSVVGRLGVSFLVQAASFNKLQPIKEAISDILLLNVEDPNYFSSINSLIESSLAAFDSISASYPLLEKFSTLRIDALTGSLIGDFDSFAREFIKEQPNFYAGISQIIVGGAPPPSIDPNAAGYISLQIGPESSEPEPDSNSWAAWFRDEGSLIFDVAALMDIDPEYVMNITGWRWLTSFSAAVEGTSGDDTLSETVSTRPYINRIFTGDGGIEYSPSTVETRDQRLYGYDGNDILYGNDGADSLIGGAGNDQLFGGTGSDMYVYSSGDGLDVIHEENGEGDAVFFSNGLDVDNLRVVRISNTYDLQLHFGDISNGIILKDQILMGGAGVETFSFVGASPLSAGDVATIYLKTFSTAGNDIITGTHAGESIYGLAGDDTLNGWDGDDILYGGEGVDILNGELGNDLIYGEAGNDVIDAGAGNDTVIGGAGDDVIQETTGDDTYVWNIGDGDDFVAGGGFWDGINTIQFGPGITANDLIYSYTGTTSNGLKIGIAGQPGSITIELQMTSTDVESIDRLTFVDGTVLTRAEFTAAALSQLSTSGDDTLWGSNINDNISAGAGNDVIDPRAGNDTVIGGAGDDVIQETTGDDTYVWNIGDGNDFISGAGFWDGINTIQFGPGISAEDLVYSYADSSGVGLKIGVAGQAGSITIQYQMAGTDEESIDRLTFVDGTVLTRAQFRAAALAQLATSGNDLLWGTGGDDIISGGAGNDTIDSRGGTDIVIGGAGNDTIFQTVGDDTYVWNIGDGDDFISGGGFWDGVNTIQFGAGITADNLVYSYADNAGKNLKIGVIGQAGSVTIENQVISWNDERIDQLKFSDGSILSRSEFQAAALAQLGTAGNDTIWGTNYTDMISGGAGNDLIDGREGNDTIIGGLGNDTIIEGNGNDTYVWNLGDGDDVISGSRGADFNVLKFGASISASHIRAAHREDGPGLVISVDGQAGSITVNGQIDELHFASDPPMSYADVFALAGPIDSSLVLGTSASDSLVGTSASETFKGMGGDDYLEGNGGSDTYVYASGDGNDIVWDIDSAGAVDVLKLTDLNPANVTLRRDPLHLYVKDNSTGQEITVWHQFNTHGVEQIKFADGTIWDKSRIELEAAYRGTSGNDSIAGGAGNETFIGGLGNDYLEGNIGSDTYVYASGDGADDIWDLNAAGAVDTLKFTDLNPANVTLRRDALHLYVKDNATGQETRVQHQFNTHGLEQIKFADGTVWDKTRIGQEAWYRGTAGADSILGTAQSETFLGGTGNDYLEGGAGSDTFVYASGDGADDIWDLDSANAVDVLKLVDLNPTDVTLRKDGVHLYVKDNTTNQELRVQHQFNTHGVEQIQFANGTIWSRTDIEVVTNGGLVLNGGSGNDLLAGGAGNDLARGKGGNDTIDLGLGTDVAEFAGLQADYSLVTSGGTITITDDQPTVDGDDGTDTLVSVETARFKNGAELNLAAPIVLDLDGNGVSLIDPRRSSVRFDWDGDGVAERTGWVGRKDGFLAYDRNGDGKVSRANELSFLNDKPGAVSDLDGLSAFDTNGDGMFSSEDEKFADFRVWRDANGNGRSEKRELKSLEQAGIASIDLQRTAVDQEWAWGDNVTLATGSFTRSDGSKGAVGDVALNYSDAQGAHAASLAASQLAEAMAAFRNDNGGDQLSWLHDQLEHRQQMFVAGGSLR